ncbi:hypothetical protein FG05_30215 [Fusarium graminearum]|nr:hypothetical protein FG05_30215 [Fusarium graminearum]
MVGTSSIGSGGIRQCSKDKTRAYCCTDPAPVPFGNHCEWVQKAGWVTDQSANLCEAACHKGQVRIALEYGNRHANFGEKACKGKDAFCCDLESELEKRGDEEDDEEETAGSVGAREFKTLMSKYLDIPTCPATILQPDIYDGVNEAMLKKRDLIAESMDHEVLHERAVDCTLKNWNRLLTLATLMFTLRDSAYQGIVTTWDNDFADPLDEEYTFSSMQDFFYDYPMYDRRATLAYILYNPHTAGEGLRRARGVENALCQVPSSVASRRSLEASSLDKRVIWVYEKQYQFGIPSLTSILRAIRLGRLTLHYACWEWISGGEPMLELAYWIGREPGVEDSNPDLDDYRDTRDGNRDPDRWVGKFYNPNTASIITNSTQSFTFDITPSTDWLQRINGRTYMGVTGMTVFHGQEAAVEGAS